MTPPGAVLIPKFRLGLLLWLAGMAGLAVFTFVVLPQVLRTVPLPIPIWVVLLTSLLQNSILIALAVWAGVALAPAVGLHAPIFEAAVTSHPMWAALRPQLLPGLVVGVLGGVFLSELERHGFTAPPEIQQKFSLPLGVRVLYGGIAEEILSRWGVMTALVWLAWRFLQHRAGTPKSVYIWSAIVVSALLFGLGHLPAAVALLGTLEGYLNLLLILVAANTLFGVVFGYLYWRWGLEAAMLAHATAHLAGHAISLISSRIVLLKIFPRIFNNLQGPRPVRSCPACIHCDRELFHD